MTEHIFYIAKQSGRRHKKGEVGLFVEQEFIDSENYLFLDMMSGESIGPSLEDYWEILLVLDLPPNSNWKAKVVEHLRDRMRAEVVT